MEHRNLKGSDDGFGWGYFIIAFLLIINVALPFYGITSPFGDKHTTMSILDLSKNNGESIFGLYLLPILSLLLLFGIDRARKNLGVFTKFSWAVVALYIVTFIFVIVIGILYQEPARIEYSGFGIIKVNVFIGFVVLVALAALYFIIALIDVCTYYKWYPCQTLIWLLSPLAIIFLSGFVSTPFMFLMQDDLMTAYFVGYLIMLGIIILCSFRVKKWNRTIRRKIARRHNSSLYLNEDDKNDPEINVYDTRKSIEKETSEETNESFSDNIEEKEIETEASTISITTQSVTHEIDSDTVLKSEEKPIIEDSFDVKYEDKKRKWMKIGGLAGAVALLAIGGYFLFTHDNDSDGIPAYVLDTDAIVYKEVEDWNGSDPQGKLPYGAEVMTFEKDPTESWIRVSATKDGKKIKGYVDATKLTDGESYETINERGGLNKESVRQKMYLLHERMALLEKLKALGPDWRLQIVDSKYGELPLLYSGYIDGLSPNEFGFYFIVQNEKTGEKQFVLYSFDSDHNPVPVYEEPVADKWEGISDVSIKRGKVKVKYYEGDSDMDDSESKLITGSIVFKGLIDNQYPVTMSINLSGNTVTGTYYYDKYKSPISLNGEFSVNEDGDKIMTLSEMNNGEMTGQFIGTWSGDSFSGSWISADGEKEMPFKLNEN